MLLLVEQVYCDFKIIWRLGSWKQPTMFANVAKSSGMAQFFKASTGVVNAAKSVLNPSLVIPVSTPAARWSAETLRRLVPRGTVCVTTGLSSITSVRCAHTDIRVPDYSDYRRESTKDPTSRASCSAPERLSFTYLITGGGKQNSVKALINTFNYKFTLRKK